MRGGWVSSRSARSRPALFVLALVPVAALVCATAARGDGTRLAPAPTLVLDNSFALDTTDPQRAFDPTSSIVDRAVYDTLFTYRKNDLAHPIPLLVQSWTSADAKAFTFRLKRNVHFADGTPLTSADVVFSFSRLVNLRGNPAFLLSGVKVSAKDAYTVVIESSTPAPQLPSVLANPSTGIVNSKLVRSHGGSDGADAFTADRAEQWFNSAASAGAGSGPYVLHSYIPTSQITLRPNPDYWGARKPAFSTVVIRNMPAPTQLINIRRGAHQVAIDLSSDQADTLKGDTSLHVTREPSPFVFYVFANDDPQISGITSNKRFQRAVRSALDYESLLALAGPGAIQAPGMISSMILGALPQSDAVRHDLPMAKAELAASGVGSQRVTLEYPSDVTVNGVSFATLAQKVQADLQAAGFDVALAGSPVTTFQPKFRAGKVAFGLWVWAPDYPDPADYLVFTPGKLIALHVGWPAGSDPVIEKLAAKASVTTAPARRRSVYQQIQRALNARGPFFPLMQPTQVFAATSDLAGAVFSGAYDVDVTQISPR
jgi:peptide/nickel transport system substrate-binding protein